MFFEGIFYTLLLVLIINYLMHTTPSPPLFQDSVFQCQLPHQFREVDCNRSNLKLEYVDSNISSPPFSKIFLLVS